MRKSHGHTGSVLSPILLVGGIALAVAMSSRRVRRALTSRAAKLRRFRRAIDGVDKRTVAAALGAPAATVGVGDFLRDDTWYYSLNPVAQTALAVSFDVQGVARRTQVLKVPRK
jgi:hypothetical protein